MRRACIYPRSIFSCIRQDNQSIMTRLTPRRLHQTMSTGSAIPPRPIAIANMPEQRIPVTEDRDSQRAEPEQKKSINLLRGWPATSLLPAAALRAASQTALSDPRIWGPGLEYGPDPGYQPLREELARWLGRFYNETIANTTNGAAVAEAVRVDANRITVTGGASQSVACLLQSFTDPSATLAVWMLAPCYFLACQNFADAGFAGRMRAVPEDEEGVDLGFLERAIRALEESQSQGRGRGVEGPYKEPGVHRKIYRHVVYCVPSFANPSGRTMTLARRRGLVQLAREHDALVICDDVYDMLQWQVQCPAPAPTLSSPSSSSSLRNSALSSSSSPSSIPDLNRALLPRLADIDIAQGRSPHDPPGKHFGHVVSNGSFSKLVAPGARTGWTYSTADFALGMAHTGSTRSGGAPSQLTATIVCELLKQPSSTSRTQQETECVLDAYIRHTLRPAYARRHGLLMRAIRDVLVPLGIQVEAGSLCGHEGVFGGYFVWMILPFQTRGTDGSTEPSGTWPTARAIADRCRADEDLLIGHGELFAVHGDEAAVRFDDAIRLCFAWENEEDIVDGVERLGRVIRKMLKEEPKNWETEDRGQCSVDQNK
ncbi:pyridoxal phosphate-dependent transferase [Xylariaceae sp. FL1651]|nr:pyridoxal phosphate-dependent transferase [Xylariaceae sp. FL1651]